MKRQSEQVNGSASPAANETPPNLEGSSGTGSGEDEMRRLTAEILRLANAMMNGRLDERGKVELFPESQREVIILLNQMLDALIKPLRVASRSIDQIAHGVIPEFVIDEYKGEFNSIKKNLNTFLAVMYGMHHETANLIQAIKAGKLKTRGNAWDFEGNWKNLIDGVNGTLDAVMEPVNEARGVLEKLSNYDLCARMEGHYKGEHTQTKRAINATGEALHGALAQVSDSVVRVSATGKQVSTSSQEVSQGVSEQARSIEETSEEVTQIAANSEQNAEKTEQARSYSQEALDSVSTARGRTDKMIVAMGDIRSSAENVVTIIHEINDIARQTDTLAAHAAIQAAKVGASGRGFAVVAEEVRKLAARSKEAADKMGALTRKATENVPSAGENGGGTGGSNNAMLEIVRDIGRIAFQTNFLALNAAIEAAHVEDASRGFEAVTEEVRKLSTRSKEAGLKTESLVQRSVDLAKNGEALSADIGKNLNDVVAGVGEVARLVEDISISSQDQKRGVGVVNQSVGKIQGVIQQNAANAEKLSSAAGELESQNQKLSALVNRFRIRG